MEKVRREKMQVREKVGKGSKRETEPEDDLTKDKREVRRRGKASVASSSRGQGQVKK